MKNVNKNKGTMAGMPWAQRLLTGTAVLAGVLMVLLVSACPTEPDDPNTNEPVNPSGYVAVTEIRGVPREAKIGVPVTLAGSVLPVSATNKTIVWSITSGPATLGGENNNILTATDVGTVMVIATIANGKTASTPYIQECPIEVVFVPVTDITGVPTRAVVDFPLPLTGITVVPNNADNNAIVWSLESGPATLVDNVLTATAKGTVVLKATIDNGLTPTTPYTDTFSIEVITLDEIVLEFPKVIDDFSGAIGDYSAFAGNSEGGWQLDDTDGRPNLYASIIPTSTGSRFGRTGMNIDISEYIYKASTCLVLDASMPSPYPYTFELTVNGTVYSVPVTNVQSPMSVITQFPLSQLKNPAGASLAEQRGTLTVSGWAIRCALITGRTGTRVFAIDLKEGNLKTITKGSATGSSGNDFTLPEFDKVPVGNAVPVRLSLAPSNALITLTFTPDTLSVEQGRAGATLCYFIMPDSDITVSAEFERVAEPPMWVIEDFTDAGKRNVTGWYKDWVNNTYGYWSCNLATQWTNSNLSGPHWIAAYMGDAMAGSDYFTIKPLNRWILQIEAANDIIVGRNLPVAMNISLKDTIRLLFRRSGDVSLDLGLFNGGQPLASYGAENGSGEVIDPEKSGTGYWVAIPPNTNITSIADSSWDYLEIPLTSFTELGFNAELLTGYGIRVTDYTAEEDFVHSRPRFYLDNIVALNQADYRTITVDSLTGGTIDVPYTKAVGGQIIPITGTPAAGYVFELTTSPAVESADVNPLATPMAIIMPDSNLTITGSFRALTLTPFEDFETGGTFTNLTNAWTSATHNNVSGWFTVTSSNVNNISDVSGEFDTAETRPGTTGSQSLSLTWTQTGNNRSVRIGYKYPSAIDATGYTYISFWVRSNRTGTYNVVLRNSTNTDNSVDFIINAADTWEQKTVALPASRNAINYLGFGSTATGSLEAAQLWIDDASWGE